MAKPWKTCELSCPYQYSYTDGDVFHFLNQETWDDVTIERDMITGVDYEEGDVLDVVSVRLQIRFSMPGMPVKTKLKIVYTDRIERRYCDKRNQTG